MKGLMHVADEVQKELQRDEPFLRNGLGVREFGRELVDLVDNARGRRPPRCGHTWGQRGMPVAHPVEVRAVELDVHEMPLSGVPVTLSGPVPIGVSISIGPCRFAGDIVRRKVVVIGGEHRDDHGARCRFEILLGNKRDDLVPLVAPGCRVRR
jgi:hypothetical protein